MDARERRTLVLSAFPAEADAILSHTLLERFPVVVADRRHFYLGSIGGNKVIVAMTGIGMVNATDTAQAAFARFGGECFAAVVFSGVAGGGHRPRIGDVVVPARWTLDRGATFRPVDSAMLAEAKTLTAAGLCKVASTPRVWVGGDGCSFDNNNGQAFPCVPCGGSVFGCRPRHAPNRSLLYAGNFFRAVGPWLRHGLAGNVNIASAGDPAFDATDQETGAVQAVADAHGVPFLGIRGISDGAGDPLHLPGFPFQFFVYKRIAAHNAARATAAFLRGWAGT